MKSLTALPLLLLLLCGCATIDPTADPFVVHSERTINYATETVDSFLQWEYQNRAFLAETGATEATQAADALRREFPILQADAKRLVRAYKVSRTQPNYEAAATAVELLNEAIKIARRYLTPPPPTS